MTKIQYIYSDNQYYFLPLCRAEANADKASCAMKRNIYKQNILIA